MVDCCSDGFIFTPLTWEGIPILKIMSFYWRLQFIKFMTAGSYCNPLIAIQKALAGVEILLKSYKAWD